MPPALLDSQLTALHQSSRGGGGKVAGRQGLPLNLGGPSLGLEAAAMRSKLAMALSQF